MRRFYQDVPKQSPLLLSLANLILAASQLAPASTCLGGSPVAQDDKKSEATKGVAKRVFSGPQVGEKIRPFKVLHVLAEKTKELEVGKPAKAGAGKAGDKKVAARKVGEPTTLICFVHRLSTDDRILFGLGLVDFYAARHKGLSSHFVLLSNEREKMTKMLKGWARGSLFKNSVVSLSADGANGPGYYGLNRHVAMTVIVAKGNKVVSNLVFNAPNGRDLEKIMAAVAKAYGKPAPKLAKVQQELRAERQRQMAKRIKASPVFKLAPNEQLGRIMFGMVNGRGNRSLVAKRRSKQLRDWAGDNKDRKATLRKYCKAVLTGNFKLNRYSREALENLAKE